MLEDAVVPSLQFLLRANDGGAGLVGLLAGAADAAGVIIEGVMRIHNDVQRPFALSQFFGRVARMTGGVGLFQAHRDSSSPLYRGGDGYCGSDDGATGGSFAGRSPLSLYL